MSDSVIRYMVTMLKQSSLVSPLLGDRIYANMAPLSPARPYITLQLVSDVPVNTLDGRSNLSRCRVQADIIADDYYTAVDVAEAVKDAVAVEGDWAHRPLVSSSRDFFEYDTKRHRVSMDLILWHISNVTSP